MLCLKQIHNRWKLQSIEQQQKEVQEKQQAKEQAKKAQGTNSRSIETLTLVIYLCLNACICLSEERKKAKLGYQESLQNVHSVRQQVAVRKRQLTNFTSCIYFA